MPGPPLSPAAAPPPADRRADALPTRSWGREQVTDLAWSGDREWLCCNGLGSYASGTVSGIATRTYHGLLIAALQPPDCRTLMAGRVEDAVVRAGQSVGLSANRWLDGSVAPQGYALLDAFHLEGTMPVWTYRIGSSRLEKRLCLQPERQTTALVYRLLEGPPVDLRLRLLTGYRDHHATTTAGTWRMQVDAERDGVRVVAFPGARPLHWFVPGAQVEPAHIWYHGFLLNRERERGLPDRDDLLHVATAAITLADGASCAVIASAEPQPERDAGRIQASRRDHDQAILSAGRRTFPAAPSWCQELLLAADAFIVQRPAPAPAAPTAAAAPVPALPARRTVIAGYHWFLDWGRDTMLSLPGLTWAAGRDEIAQELLVTWASFLDQGMLPNRFPDGGAEPEYTSVDAALLFVQALADGEELTAAQPDRASAMQAMIDAHLDAVGEIVTRYHDGTRHGIRADPADGLLTQGAAGLQLTWMDARIAGEPVTPRHGKAIELNAWWYQAVRFFARHRRRRGHPEPAWEALADRIRASFQRFWLPAGYAADVIDGPEGCDGRLRPNQLAVLAARESLFTPRQGRQALTACRTQLRVPSAVRSLAPDDTAYRAHYGGPSEQRDAAYHQGTAWPWLLGLMARCQWRLLGDARGAKAMVQDGAALLDQAGLGTICEVVDGDPPFRPGGCIAQAWSVAQLLHTLALVGACR